MGTAPAIFALVAAVRTRARATVLALPLLAACAAGPPQPTMTADAIPGVCVTSGPPKPIAHIGPDVQVRAPCGLSGRAAVASVDEQGPGLTTWSVSLDNPTAFSLDQIFFDTCQKLGPSVAFVSFGPPPGSMPGDAFDTVATISAIGDVFPPGRVKVHGEVIVPRVSADQTTVELGDVAPFTDAAQLLSFRNEDAQPLSFASSVAVQGPFTIAMAPGKSMLPTSTWQVNFAPSGPGDYAATVTFTATPQAHFGIAPACSWRQDIALHAHVPGTPDGGAGAGDGGGDGP
jgi:hypothetical protein